MKLTAKHIGVLSALLLSATHAASAVDSNELNNVSNITASSNTGEAVTIVATMNEADNVTNEAGMLEIVTQPSHLEEISASFSELKKALDDGFHSSIKVAHGIADTAKSTFFLAKDVVNLTESFVRFTWFTGKIIYSLGAITVEYAQSVYASK